MPNNTLQGTFDPWPIFAAAKMFPASNAPERGRSPNFQNQVFIPLRLMPPTR